MFLFIKPSIIIQGIIAASKAVYKFANLKYLKIKNIGNAYMEMIKIAYIAPNTPFEAP